MTTSLTDSQQVKQEVDADAMTGAHGSHPVETSLGAGGGAAAGATAGAFVGGPVSAVVGGVIGAVVGGLAGRAAGEAVDPTRENAFWETNYHTRHYVDATRSYLYYQDAYRYGWEARASYPGRKWDDVEPDLSKGWEKSRGKSALAWEHAKSAARDAWNRLEKVLPGDSDHDGR